jgi:hypothetical protein
VAADKTIAKIYGTPVFFNCNVAFLTEPSPAEHKSRQGPYLMRVKSLTPESPFRMAGPSPRGWLPSSMQS